MRVVIMGGTSGIGLATAKALAADGAEVTVTGRDPARLDAARDIPATAVRLDATDETEVAEFFTRTGPIDHLVLAFSPGAVGLGPLADVELTDVRAAFEGKLFPYLFAIQQAEVTGSITLLSAATARSALAGTTALAAVNGAIERAVSPLAAELAPVRVNAVSPGAVDTPWWSFLPEDARQAQFKAAADTVPAGRVGDPADVAEAIRYLIGAEYVTGSILPVDGGMTVA
ncbi:SDR family oxidoreductase [Streptomyces acidiscabies]|uniref:SDR family oxidoreductase n=1 Tax=Streptomyces acidiscabies TaxID=42234 RepID=A0AAP6EFK7_9ACTN|nr:SDR family oxidoreductase [Streptomyces acidiscabies]MBP5937521.1 SDR family oxidoreductase [Streptomyces sp. LBUM 1476]MBZ3914389.1 SDR family oxidoreductase [Streptomyces acidiscabies]MDX2961023.1 SDR family oxidoreductase [Streptomyces acidiscabies]MDX3017080.1 SDR family oxidoreductase [Streptomyces acidiscabies]MDX3789031.1 SDR family oxidoreductase [Streptomyces acidiscabies]